MIISRLRSLTKIAKYVNTSKVLVPSRKGSHALLVIQKNKVINTINNANNLIIFKNNLFLFNKYNTYLNYYVSTILEKR